MKLNGKFVRFRKTAGAALDGLLGLVVGGPARNRACQQYPFDVLVQGREGEIVKMHRRDFVVLGPMALALAHTYIPVATPPVLLTIEDVRDVATTPGVDNYFVDDICNDGIRYVLNNEDVPQCVKDAQGTLVKLMLAYESRTVCIRDGAGFICTAGWNADVKAWTVKTQDGSSWTEPSLWSLVKGYCDKTYYETFLDWCEGLALEDFDDVVTKYAIGLIHAE